MEGRWPEVFLRVVPEEDAPATCLGFVAAWKAGGLKHWVWQLSLDTIVWRGKAQGPHKTLGP